MTDVGGEAGAPETTAPVLIRVVRATTGERVPSVVVELEKDGERRVERTDEDGDLPADLELAPGIWNVAILGRDFRPEVAKLTVPVRREEQDETSGKVVYRIFSLTDDIDQQGGKKFFIGLIVTLVLFGVAYVLLHVFFPQTRSLASTLVTQTIRAQTSVRQAPDPRVDPDLSQLVASMEKSIAESESQDEGELAELKKQVEELASLLRKGPGDGEVEPAAAEAAVAAVKEQALEKLGQVGQLAIDLADEGVVAPQADSFFFWTSGLKRYLEVLSWAFAGILARLIFTVGGYLRWNRFYRKGLFLHWTLLVVSPLLTVVFVLLISLIKVSGDTLAVDFSDPRILAGVSFILAATPWRLWERLQSVGERIVGQGRNEGATG